MTPLLRWFPEELGQLKSLLPEWAPEYSNSFRKTEGRFEETIGVVAISACLGTLRD